jgi:hypothetical protein
MIESLTGIASGSDDGIVPPPAEAA